MDISAYITTLDTILETLFYLEFLFVEATGMSMEVIVTILSMGWFN